MNKNRNNAEKGAAELLSEFVDRLNEGTISTDDDSLESFLGEHAEQPRSLFTTAMIMNREGKDICIPQEKKEAVYQAIIKKVKAEEAAVEKTKATPGISLEQRSDFLILMLHVFGRVWGTTRVFKNLFLMGKEAGLDAFARDYYPYLAYNFGPFEQDIYRDLEALEIKKIIRKRQPGARRREASTELVEGVRPEKVDGVFELTEKGGKIAAMLERSADGIDPEIMEKIKGLKEEYGELSLRELLNRVYTKYPEYAEKSVIRDEVLGGGNGEDEEVNGEETD